MSPSDTQKQNVYMNGLIRLNEKLIMTPGFTGT